MSAQNLLLSVLPQEIRDKLSPHSKQVDLSQGQVLHRPGQEIEEVYFPLTCMLSVTIIMDGGRTVEAGTIGSREMVGINAFMGGSETTQTTYITQVAGLAIRMPAEPLRVEFDRSKPLRDIMLRYTQAYIAQLSQNVACNRMHTLDQRMARWLLETRDRLQSEDLQLSHEFISYMLGVRRAGVSEAAAAMQERGLIEYGRMSIKLVDSLGLEETSCECYGVLRDEYTRLLSPMKT